MTPKTLRLIGVYFLIAAAVMAVLNLKRVADLGLNWLNPILLILGLVFIIRARRKSR